MQIQEASQEGDAQDNFLEARDPAELMMCFILAAAYLGLAKFCWEPLLLVKNWKLLVNVEGFFVTIAVLSILIGLRPYMSPCSLQLSGRGIKYRGPYWPQRKTVNWEQVKEVFVSPELVVVMHQPKVDAKGKKLRVWPLLIWSIYLADRQNIPAAVLRHCPIQPVMMTNPHLISKIILGLVVTAIIIWLLEMLIAG
jgi:hypothetical protein